MNHPWAAEPFVLPNALEVCAVRSNCVKRTCRRYCQHIIRHPDPQIPSNRPAGEPVPMPTSPLNKPSVACTLPAVVKPAAVIV